MIGLSGTLSDESALTVIFVPPAGTLTCWYEGMESPAERGSGARSARAAEKVELSGKSNAAAMRRVKPASRPARASPRERGRVVLFNKPYGVLCQFSGDGARPTLKDYLDVPDVYPAGRLDADSEGLVVLTADGALQARIASPRHKLPKIYWVQVEGMPSAVALDELRRGVDL